MWDIVSDFTLNLSTKACLLPSLNVSSKYLSTNSSSTLVLSLYTFSTLAFATNLGEITVNIFWIIGIWAILNAKGMFCRRFGGVAGLFILLYYFLKCFYVSKNILLPYSLIQGYNDTGKYIESKDDWFSFYYYSNV